MSDPERMNRLEDAVKHLILSEKEKEEYEAHDSVMTMEEFGKKRSEHQTVFQKFLYQLTK